MKISGPSFSLLFIFVSSLILELKDTNRDNLIPYSNYLMLAVQIIIPIVLALAFKLKILSNNKINFFLIYGFIIIFFISILSSFWSDFPVLVLQRSTLTYLPLFVVAYFFYADGNKNQTFINISYALVLSISVLAFLGLFLYFLGQDGAAYDQRIQTFSLGPIQISQLVYGIPPFLRISSITGNPNSLASLILIGLPLSFCLYHSKKIGELSLFLLFSIMFTALLLTFSKTGTISSIIALLIYMQINAKRKNTYTFIVIFLLVTLFVTIQLIPQEYLLPASQSDRFSFDINQRDIQWSHLLNSISNNFFFGVGFGVSFEKILHHSFLLIGGHSFHLVMMAEIGVLAYALFTIIYLNVLIKSFYNTNTKDQNTKTIQSAVFALLIAIFVHQFFELSFLRFGFINIYIFYLLLIGSHNFKSRRLFQEAQYPRSTTQQPRYK